MANYSKFIKLLLSFVIAISPIILINNANAASLGGWTLGGGVAQGASTVYEGTKKVIIDGKDYIKKGTAKITPTATNVAKVLARGAGGLALSVAVEQLLGAVDWVLDPANNQIKYTDPNALPKQQCVANGSDCPASRYLYYSSATGNANYFSTLQAAIKYRLNKDSSKNTLVSFILTADGNPSVVNVTYSNTSTSSACYKTPCSSTYAFYRLVNPNYDSSAQEEDRTKTLPLETVAQKVISNAQSGDSNAQVATTAAAADIVAEAEKDNVKARPIAQQLESSASTKPADAAEAEKANEATGTQTQNPTKPETTDLKLEFPVFCNWAPIVCEAAQKVISFPITLTEWWTTGKEKAESWATSISEAWTAAKEWATSEPSQDNTQVDVENNNTQEIDTQVSFSSQCPANIKLADFSYHGISQSWDVDFSKFCDVFATYLRPVVISIGAFSAVLIVSGVGVRENG